MIELSKSLYEYDMIAGSSEAHHNSGIQSLWDVLGCKSWVVRFEIGMHKMKQILNRLPLTLNLCLNQ